MSRQPFYYEKYGEKIYSFSDIIHDLGLYLPNNPDMSIEEILAKITEISKGQAAAAAATYAGKLDKLEVAAANASETIGGALVDAFSSLAGNGDIDKAISKMDYLVKIMATLISPKLFAEAFEGVEFKYGFIPIKKPVTPGGPAQQSPGERNAAVA
jgi:hypothetical protein